MLSRVTEFVFALISPLLLILLRADARSAIYRRAEQAEQEGYTELAAQLRQQAASFEAEQPKPALPSPAPIVNGQLPAPRKVGRPRKEVHGVGNQGE